MAVDHAVLRRLAQAQELLELDCFQLLQDTLPGWSSLQRADVQVRAAAFMSLAKCKQALLRASSCIASSSNCTWVRSDAQQWGRVTCKQACMIRSACWMPRCQTDSASLRLPLLLGSAVQQSDWWHLQHPAQGNTLIWARSCLRKGALESISKEVRQPARCCLLLRLKTCAACVWQKASWQLLAT